MICRKCGCDKLDVINVFRNRRRVKGKWIVDGDFDSRLVICKECGKRDFTQTTFDSELIFNEENYKLYEKDSDGNISLFEDDNA